MRRTGIPLPKHLLLLLSLAACASFSFAQLPCPAEIGSSLLDTYLQREFAFAFTIDVAELPQYFNYEGSSLRPITKVLVKLYEYGDTAGTTESGSKESLYEEFWYHKKTALAFKRSKRLDLSSQKTGAIVIRYLAKRDENADVGLNAALRVLLDLQFKNLNAGSLIVPIDQFERVCLQLESYGFAAMSKVKQDPLCLNGKQLRISLRSYPGLREESFLYRK